MFTDTITLYKHSFTREAETWTREVITGVQVSDATVNDYKDGVAVKTVETRITIPGAFDGKIGDVVVLTNCTQEITNSYTIDQLMNEYKAVVIQRIKDNTRRTYLKNTKLSCV